MPLGVRDVLLVIRAKDQASRQVREVGLAMGALGGNATSLGTTLSRVGETMIGVGAGITALGVGGLVFIKSSVEAFADFDAASRKTLTQVSQFPASLKEVEQVALDVGRTIAVPFEQLQPALFDIFSSIPVANMQEAKQILTEMSKAAVAGATDVQTVARSNFEVMNAFGLKVGDLNHLLDVQFTLVKLGIGDYADINTGIGRLAPTAQVAGQSIETMAGSLAFATRIMGPGGTAVSSVARAFEALANPKVVGRLEAMGITVRDTAGNFLPFNFVLTELGDKLRGLPAPDKVKAITEIFKGAGGTIQARRFLTEAINQTDALNISIDAMNNSAGALDQAYAIMADAPVNQVQLLSNNFEELQIAVGEAAAPVLLDLVGILQDAVGWFNDLDDSTKATISRFILWGSVIAIVSGLFIILSGIALVFIGTLVTMGVSVGLAVGIFLLIPVALAAIGVAIYLAIANLSDLENAWDSIYAKFQEVWIPIRDDFVEIWDTVYKAVKENWPKIRDTIVEVSNSVGNFVSKLWPHIRDAIIAVARVFTLFAKDVLPFLVKGFASTFHIIGEVIKTVLPVILPFLEKLFDVITAVFNFVADHWNVFGPLLGIMLLLASPVAMFLALMILLEPAIEAVLKFLQDNQWILQVLLGILILILSPLIAMIVLFVLLKAAAEKLWDFFNGSIIPVIQGVIDKFKELWHDVMEPIINFLGDAWHNSWDSVRGFFDDKVSPAINGVKEALNQLWHDVMEPVVNFLNGVFGPAVSYVGGLLVAFGITFSVLGQVAYIVWQTILQPIAQFLGVVLGGVLFGLVVLLFGLQQAWEHLGGILGWFKSVIIDPLANALEHIVDVLRTMLDLIEKVTGLGPLGGIFGGGATGSAADLVNAAGGGGAHAGGGVIPGPRGQPRLALVHGGEQILGYNEHVGGGMVNYFDISAVGVNDPEQAATLIAEKFEDIMREVMQRRPR